MSLWIDLAHRAKVMARLGEEREVLEEEFQCLTKSGGIRIGQFSGALIEIDGRLHALVEIHDITARKRAEDSLRASEKRFRRLVESLHIGVALFGPQAEVLFANHAALQMVGLPLA